MCVVCDSCSLPYTGVSIKEPPVEAPKYSENKLNEKGGGVRTCKKKDQPKYIVSSCNFLCRSTAASTNGVDEDWRLPSQSKLGHLIRFILLFLCRSPAASTNGIDEDWRLRCKFGHLTRLIVQFLASKRKAELVPVASTAIAGVNALC